MQPDIIKHRRHRETYRSRGPLVPCETSTNERSMSFCTCNDANPGRRENGKKRFAREVPEPLSPTVAVVTGRPSRSQVIFGSDARSDPRADANFTDCFLIANDFRGNAPAPANAEL